MVSTPPSASTRIARVAVPLLGLGCLLPQVSSALALVLGLAAALALGNPYLATTRTATRHLLSVAVVGLGAGMNLHTVASAGAHGLAYTVAGIALCLALAAGLTRALGVASKVGALIGVGTAICGGSAIAAVAPVIEAEDHEVSVALGTVFLLNALALVIFPPLGHLARLSDGQFGLWSALAIHDTSSVVGAAVAFGGKAVEVATPVKLARALWIVPVTLGFGAWRARGASGAVVARPKVPLFILGFVLAAALVTWVPALQPAGNLCAAAARRLLAVTLFLIGANLTRSALRAVGVRPLFLGVLLWLVMGCGSLAAIAVGWAR